MNSFLRGLRRFSETLFGAWEIQWSPPDWIEESGDCIEDHPKIAAAVLWLAILGGGFGIWSFFQSPPEVPDALAVAIEAPGLASVKKDENGKSYLKPSPLKITFDQSAAPLDQLPNETEGESAPPVSGIRLEPAVNGLWRWVNDQTLHFDPTEDWLPDRNYQILWDEADLVAEGRRLPTPKGPEFATKPFTAAVEKQSFYQNPRDPSVKQGVVTLRFSHGVAQNSLRSRTTIEVLGEEALFDPSQEEALQEIVFHDFDRMATLRTAPLILPTEESFLQFTIQPGISPALGSSRTEEPMESRVKIPSVYTHFQISSARVLSRRNEKGEPFPALQIKTSSLIEPASFHPALTLHLLPPFEEPDTWPEGEVKPTAWTLDTLTDEILAQADPLSLTADTIPSSGPSSTRQVTYDFPHQPEGRQLIVQVPAETQALGGYRLKEDFQTLLDVPEGPREVHLLGRFGGVLALTGDRKITIKSRNLSTLKVRLGRVPVGQINHLVSQTGGDFRTPYFKNYSFDETNFAHFAEELQPVFPRNSFEANYNSIDLTRFLGMEDPLDPDPSRGLYFLRAYGWNAAENERQYSGGQEGDQAFLLVTDLGIIAKRNEDSTRDVFVQSLADGSPVSEAEVQILSKNGTPLVTSTTDAEGRAQLAAVDQSLQDERKPVAIIVRKGTDLSFLPMDRYQRRLSYSRFDTRGISAPTPSDLDGFLFNERGIYRPGETIHSGVIIKPRDWAGRLEDLPIKVTVQDPRNRTILESILSLPESGFLDFSTPTEPSYATGRYKLRAYLVHPEDEDGHQESDTLLASSSVRVEEFLPDTMTVKAELSPAPESGWLTSRDLTVSVQADNLVGTPAVDRKILGQITATPSRFAFDDFPGYVFFDRNLKHARASSWETKEGKTSDTGAYETSLDLSKLAAATYRLRYEAKVFEPGSGRNVRGISQSVVVSPLQQAVGYKPEGGLRYIPRGTEATVSLVAVNPQVQRIPLSNLSVRVIETYYASILKQQSGGDYAYESVKRERDVSQSTLSIPRENPATFTLPTENPGEFRVSLTNAGGQEVSQFSYSVIGKGNRSRSMDDHAELLVQLPRRDWRKGENIEVSLTAPFTGSGLITVERDRVYAHRFFQTDANSTVQTIPVPDDLEGTAYVNITFLRALDSPEIFMSPLSYAVEPITIVNDSRTLTPELSPASQARPGKPLVIPYKADRPCQMAIFAVDEGILQVTSYETPEPLPHFERKRALLVDTTQILDLLMPEYRQIQEQLSAFGGGADFQLNPFKRVTDDSVVYWSGILDAGPEEQTVTYDVPDYFDGTLRIMAVAASRDGMGHVQTRTTVVSPILVQPRVPTFAAPGDTFDLSVTLTNQLPDSFGDSASIALSVASSEQLEILTPPPTSLDLAKGKEQTLTFPVRATTALGGAEVQFQASAGDESSRRRATLSIRPPSPRVTRVESGFTRDSEVLVATDRPLYEATHEAEAGASRLPLSLTKGLTEYLAEYPHGCTEQVMSGTLARLLSAKETEFGLSPAEVQRHVDRSCRLMRSRINQKGYLGMWYADGVEGIDFLTIYGTHFLLAAAEAGYEIPSALRSQMLRCLQTMAGLTKLAPEAAQDQAYAIYLLTRSGKVTTNYVLNLREFLRENEIDAMNSLTAVYLAGTYALLDQPKEAKKLIAGYQRAARRNDRLEDDFHSALSDDAQYLEILIRHFPEEAAKLEGDVLQELLAPLFEGNFSTLSGAYSVLALRALADLEDAEPTAFQVTEILPDGSADTLESDGENFFLAPIRLVADAIKFEAPDRMGFFYQVTESGYEKELPTTLLTEGIEIERQYLDADGNPITEAELGRPITVRLQLRSLGKLPVTNAAIMDLLPGGFEVDRQSLPAGRSKLPGIDFNDVREDRVVLFGTIPTKVQTLTYQINPTRKGTFVIPPIYADSMYDRSVRGYGVPGQIVVR